jgi:L-iditol 2-dehydrogenase
MRVASLEQHGVLQVIEKPAVSLNEHEVRIKVERVGICGSDVHIYESGLPWANMPLVMGHEFSGTVVETGVNAVIDPGQRVTVMPILSCGKCALCHQGGAIHCPYLIIYGVHVDGAYAEEVVVTDHRVRLLPHNMSFDQGAFVEPMAVAVHAINRSQLRPSETAVILGVGSIGMLALQELVARGSEFIMVTGRVDSKLALAKGFGASLALNATKEDVVKRGLSSIPDGFDVILDFVCSQETLEQAVTLGRPGARIVLIATPDVQHKLSINYTEAYRKELTFAPARLYTDDEFDQALALIDSGRIQTKPLITGRFSLEQAAEAMKFAQTKRAETIKVFIEPQRRNPGNTHLHHPALNEV